MPNYSGFELCRTFKSITATQMIPIIIVTGEAGANTKSYCEELGAAAYFEKPVDFEALRDRLAKILEAAVPERRSEVRIILRVTVNLRERMSADNRSRKCVPPKTSVEGRFSADVTHNCGKIPRLPSPWLPAGRNLLEWRA